MREELVGVSDERLAKMLQLCRDTLSALSESLEHRVDMQHAIRQLMTQCDMLEKFTELAVKDPDLMRVVLHASVAALVNSQNVSAIDAELNRRSVTGH